MATVVLAVARVVIAVVTSVPLAFLLEWSRFDIRTPGLLVASWLVHIPEHPIGWGPNMPFVLVALSVDVVFVALMVWYLLGILIKMVRRFVKPQ